ncbi:hypothetical protein [Reyranella sp. CPCC 100927]|uniref:hypothetical protein n=1 Tax=Reyranella sp. CPCC 100927 TaxID=2599616 RepID=UPI0011B55A86|nr:hypothetical protein [Reyranella sp. CPCC 100927]TWT11685.1 hypothetical protein FQU96_14515 [Reyranella sp. CPCC 100927]
MSATGKPAADARALARDHTQAAIDALVSVVNDTDASPSARTSAAEALLNRGWGRSASVTHQNMQDDFADILADAAAIRAARGHTGEHDDGRPAAADRGVGGKAAAVRH